VDLSGVGCGCNAAIYLVSMPQNRAKGTCANDYYCDANSVCGVGCTELDLFEGNRVAWVSTVHVADDKDGEGYGYGHYVQRREKQFVSSDERFECAYGPSPTCTINTLRPFSADITFSAAGEPFSFEVTLSQSGRSAVAGPIRYTAKPPKGTTATADDANAALRASLDAGMTLVTSYWSGAKKKDMAWLDSPCLANEIADWGCTDVWVEHPEWSWACEPTDEAPPNCAAGASAFTLRSVRMHTPSPPPAPPPAPHTYSEGFGAGVFVGMTSCALLVAFIFVLMHMWPARTKTSPHVASRSMRNPLSGAKGNRPRSPREPTKVTLVGALRGSTEAAVEDELAMVDMDEEEMQLPTSLPAAPKPVSPPAVPMLIDSDVFDAKDDELRSQPNVFDAKDQELRHGSDGVSAETSTGAGTGASPLRPPSPAVLPYFL